MVFSATRIGSTSARPSQLRVTARTILLTSTGSRAPLRLVTRICVRLEGGAVRLKEGCRGACAGALEVAISAFMVCVPLPWKRGVADANARNARRARTRRREIIPAAPPTRARLPLAARKHATVAAGLRAYGLALLAERTYWAGFPDSREPSAEKRRSFPITAAGQ